MGNYRFTEMEIRGLYVIEPQIFTDYRGSFAELYNQRDFINAGLSVSFVQDNLSISTKGVLRGLHYQKKYPQGKLATAIEGEIFSVAVDLRPDSPTYKKWKGVYLSGKNRKSLYVPIGCAYGMLVLSDYAVFFYKCTDYYNPEDEMGISWNNPEINIKWPLERVDKLIISDKDRHYK